MLVEHLVEMFTMHFIKIDIIYYVFDFVFE